MNAPFTPNTLAERLELARWFDARTKEMRSRRRQAFPVNAEAYDTTIKQYQAEAARLRNHKD